MEASDPITLTKLLCHGGRPHMGPGSALAVARLSGTTKRREPYLLTRLRVLATPCVRGFQAVHPHRIREGAGKAGCPPHPWPPCVKNARGRNHRCRRNHSGLPCAMVYGLFRTLLGDRAFLPPSLADQHPQSLASASGGQDHTTLPSASVSFVSRHWPRPSHPASTFVTTRTPLFDEAGHEE